MTRREWGWVWGVALAALIVASIPMAAGYLAETDQYRFAGAVYDVQDYFSHLAKIQLGRRGEFRYRSLFTPEPHNSEPIIYNDITLGVIAAGLGLSPALIYEISRLLGGLVLLLMVYKFISRFIEEVSTRRLAFILALLSSGLGWLFLTSPAFSYPHQSPIDFWLADGYLLFPLTSFPHYGFSIAALLAAFLAWQDYVEQPRLRTFILLLALSMTLGFLQIFELVLFDAVIALDALRHVVRQRQRLRPLGAAGLALGVVHGAMAWPYWYAAQTNVMMKVWSDQSQTLSPPPIYYLIGYGLLWPLIGLGVIEAWRRRDQRFVFPAIWIGAVAVLVYSPNGIQYRWLEGIPVALSIFAAIGLAHSLVPWVATHLPFPNDPVRRRWWITALVVVAMLPSTLYVIAGNALLAATHRNEIFFTTGQIEAMQWLAAQTQPDETVLAGLKAGGAIPAWTGHRVFLGHWAETMFFTTKDRLVKEFFSTMTDVERRALLRDYGVRYVFHSPDESTLGDFKPETVSYLVLRYQNADTAVYEVSDP